MKRVRLLDLMCSLYPHTQRERLMAHIVCKDVRVDGELVSDPKQLVGTRSSVTIETGGYVSRGALKLEHALKLWNIDVKSRVFLDAGASTGGFTDCLLSFGASYVYAVDVGYNQLDYRLRRDERVCVMERTNIMHVRDLDPVPDAAVADLSFRSITGAASHILSLTKDQLLIALIKPQFETDHSIGEFDGVVSSLSERHQILRNVYEQLTDENVAFSALTASPIPGRSGNQEYLALLRRSDAQGCRLMSESQFERNLEQLG
jgi:23S rRNA (cytidine1920-2'-O)/16S rRNA (cytidine1409-2'-O)-methyltransferase